jgi:protocatechuate 3,4-dioxygenase beta subunit
MKQNMAKLLTVALMICCLANSSFPDNCKCSAPAAGETTHQGGNEIVTFRERRAYRSVHGVVRDANGEPVEGVLVEVFDHPEWILSNYPASRVEQHRIAACKTGVDGSFCFENIPSGRYELRASKDAAWNPSHIYIVINRRSRRSTRAGINVRLTVGT